VRAVTAGAAALRDPPLHNERQARGVSQWSGTSFAAAAWRRSYSASAPAGWPGFPEAPKEPIRIEAIVTIKHEYVVVQSDLGLQ